ncbi:hypothetical protein [uncultured Aquincola sp.]|uniref:hypothetical protein n=1 Tax=uncultured Aquincola sp. TaxID=886556 RepID=UPI0032B30E99
MAEFLIRDDAASAGYAVRTGPLPRTREESYMPWALTPDGRVVYAQFKVSSSYDWRKPPGKAGLRHYGATEGRQRRALCQSRLGMIALNHLGLSERGVAKVSAGIRQFLTDTAQRDDSIRADYQASVGKYAYGLSYMSFGRFSDKVPSGSMAQAKVWWDAIDALTQGKPLAGLMNIHDNVPSKLLAKYEPNGSLIKVYRKWTELFRAEAPGELFHDDDPQSAENRKHGKTDFAPGRGRLGGIKATPSKEGGMLPAGSASIGLVQEHKRGVDMYQRKAPAYDRRARDAQTVRTKFSAISYWRDLDTRRELFGAGPSGTTGTLLASAMTFGNLGGEDLKQYCLAIIGYLVGGGCHSLHESLTVMGYHPDLEYHSSSMLGRTGQDTSLRSDAGSFPILPQSFLSSHLFPAWRDEFYDITVLGGVHWMLD